MSSTATEAALPGREAAPPFLSRERTIARPDFNRWLVPPAALAIHLCIGMAYGFSAFWLPLSRSLGITAALACGPEVGFWQELFTTNCDWRISTLGWMYTLFFVLLGSSAAIWGNWLEQAGPRKAGLVSALCWCGGMLISALGIHLHQFWLMLLGSGVIGGIGLGLGYISPVSTLIKWFPDRRGMATGMAIMGFGGGAMIGSPLAAELMAHFRSAEDVGVAPTFVVMALVHAVFMMAGALGYRVPADGWKPAGWTAIAAIAAGFTALLSLFNIGGRFTWASLSDKLGRRQTFMVFFLVGSLLYASIPTFANQGNQVLFVAAFSLIISMYGGGFSTVPAYLADLFGTAYVGAIHGRLLSAWATAGILGPVIVNYMRDYQLGLGLPREQVYNQTMYILVGMLAVGFVCNLLIRPVDPKYFIDDDRTGRAGASDGRPTGGPAPQEAGCSPVARTSPRPAPVYRPLPPRSDSGSTPARDGSGFIVGLAWLAVGLPLAWGIYRTAASIAMMFRWQ